MYAAEAGPISAVETRQMHSIERRQRRVAMLYAFLVSAADICPVSTIDSYPGANAFAISWNSDSIVVTVTVV